MIVPKLLEQEVITMLSLRSRCIISCSVSIPPISGISTSRRIQSGRSPASILVSASLPLLTVDTSNASTSSKVCRYFRMLGSSFTTRTVNLGLFSIVSLRVHRAISVHHDFRHLGLEHVVQPRGPATFLKRYV